MGAALWSAALITAGTNSEYPQDTAVDSLGRECIVGQYFGRPDLGDGARPFSSLGGVLVLRYAH